MHETAVRERVVLRVVARVVGGCRMTKLPSRRLFVVPTAKKGAQERDKIADAHAY